VVADRGVAEGGEDGGTGAGSGLVEIFAERHVPHVVEAVFSGDNCSPISNRDRTGAARYVDRSSSTRASGDRVFC
jgi:hypothetical protein